MPGSENEGWDVTEEKLKKVIKEELDIGNAVIEQRHRAKRNKDDNDNNDWNMKALIAVAKLLHFEDK